MKKTVLLIILGLVTVGCIIYGTVRHVGGGLKALRNMGVFEIDDDEDGGFDFGFHWDYDSEEGSDSKLSINQTLEKFSSIRIDSAVMDLTIEEGPEFKIGSSFNKVYLRPSYSVKNGVLEVIQQKKKGGYTGNNNCRVVITIPSGNDLSHIDINSNVGDVKIRELPVDKIDVTVNVGEIDIRRTDFAKLNAETNVGEIDIDSDGNLDEYSIDVSTDIGELSVGHKTYRHHYNSHVSGSKKISAKTNVGEINIR